MGPSNAVTEADGFLLAGEIAEAFVRVFGQSETGEEARRFLRSSRLQRLLLRFSGFLAVQIEFAIGAVDEGKLTRRRFAEKEPRQFDRILDLRKSHPWQAQARRCGDSVYSFKNALPTLEQSIAKFEISPCSLCLLVNESLMAFNSIDDFGKHAHAPGDSGPINLSRRAKTRRDDRVLSKPKSSSTPGSRWRLATVATSF